MSETSYYWQGGRKIEIERADSGVTVHADDVDEVLAASENAGIELADVHQTAPNLVRAEIPRDRDANLSRLRETHVAHHVYHTKGHPEDEVLISDTFFVKFKPGTPRSSVLRFFADENLVMEDELGGNTFLARVTDATGRNPIRTANAAALHDEVEYAEPNLVRQLVRFAHIPTDGYFCQQWHLHAPEDGEELVAGADIHAPDAWDLTRGIRDVVVCVADDGFDLTHPDFQGEAKIAGRLNAVPSGAGLTFDENVMPRPGDYHGTPCAGVAVAEENGTGTVGVAPGCAFLAVRFPLSISDAQMVILFQRVSRLADVVSCSWGYGPANAPMSSPLSEKIAQLARTGGRRGRGLVFCVAAGNNNCPIKDLNNTAVYDYLDSYGIRRRYSGPIDRWIAAHPDVLTVSACTSLHTRSAYSSWGKQVALCAPSDNWDDLGQFNPPGRGIVTTDNEGFGSGSDFTPGQRYTTRFGGTSSATPTVAGVAALVISRNQNLTAERVRGILKETANKDELRIVSDNDVNASGEFDADGHSLWFGRGKVDAAAAVRAAGGEEFELVVDLSEDAVLDIPDTGEPVFSEIDVRDEGTIQELRVGVNIEHTYIGDLRVDLLAPDGTAVTLHNHRGGTADDLVRTYTAREVPALRGFAGRSVHGIWRLRVTDTWRMDVGTLRSWRLVARVAAPVPADQREREAVVGQHVGNGSRTPRSRQRKRSGTVPA